MAPLMAQADHGGSLKKIQGAKCYPFNFNMRYYSQCGQDKFVDTFFKEMRGGVFVDFGAMDGVIMSNSYFLEKEREWTGLCIEPNPIMFKRLSNNRTCNLSNFGIADKHGVLNFIQIQGYGEGLSCFEEFCEPQHLMRIDKELDLHGGTKMILPIQVKPLAEVLAYHSITKIDYMSVDIEGAEYTALKNFDVKKYDVKLLTIENNTGGTEVEKLMNSKGYKLLQKLEWDDVYVQS